MSSRHLNRFAALGRAGTFWQQNLQPDSLKFFRALTQQGFLQNLEEALTSVVLQLAGAPRVDAGPGMRRFRSSDIAVIGPDLQERWIARYADADSIPVVVVRKPTSYDLGWSHAFAISWENDSSTNTVAAGDCTYLLGVDPDVSVSLNLDPDDMRPLYLLPLPFGELPYALRIPGRQFTLGTDYYVGHGALIFRENPEDLFPGKYFLTTNTRKDVNNLLDYTLGTDPFVGSAEPIARYFRETTSIGSLKAAAATAAGLTWLPEACVVLERYDRCVGSTYVTDKGVHEARYEHTRHARGEALAAGAVIGGLLDILPGKEYRRLDWSNGLALKEFSPVSGIVVPDAHCRVEAYDQTGDNLHARISLGCAPAAEARFWQHIKTWEAVNGNYLSAAFPELVDVGDVTTANALDVFFTYLLSQKAVIASVQVDNSGEIYRKRLTEFLKNEQPIGTLMIIKES